ncbi:hypothetical protein KAU33_16900, partial [Candidatus Dependentiae bacterium]|nr:hypothetical protein [Candidatus Dependentiae bacterium]
IFNPEMFMEDSDMKKILIFLLLIFPILFFNFSCKKYKEPETDMEKLSRRSLKELILNEYRMLEHYKMVSESFDRKPPFSIYYQEQKKRIEELKLLCDKYGLDVPKNRWEGKVPGFQIIQIACRQSNNLEDGSIIIYTRIEKSKADVTIKLLTKKFHAKSHARKSFLIMCSNMKGKNERKRPGPKHRGSR